MYRLTPVIKDIHDATFFYIQNVADLYFEYKDEEAWLMSDFTIAPPFDFFATKWTTPDSFPYEYRNLDVLSVFRTVNKVPQSGHRDLRVIGEDINLGPPQNVGKWKYEVTIATATRKNLLPHIVYYVCADEYGQIPRLSSGPAFWVLKTPAPQFGVVPNTFIQVSLLALTFLSCNNVEMLPAYPEPVKRHNAKQRNFQVKYHQLKVNIAGQRRESRGHGHGAKKGLHIVRGHFRYYGRAKIHRHRDGKDRGKLFGKLEGKYWIPTRTAGDPRLGITTKDYEVEV